MAGITFIYDPTRSAFRLILADGRAESMSDACDNGLLVRLTEHRRVCSIYRARWRDGGFIPLSGNRGHPDSREGTFEITGDELRVGYFQVRQNPRRLELWFNKGYQIPRIHLVERHEPQFGVTLFCTWDRTQPLTLEPEPIYPTDHPMIAGLAVDFAHAAIEYPITSIELKTDDFK